MGRISLLNHHFGWAEVVIIYNLPICRDHVEGTILFDRFLWKMGMLDWWCGDRWIHDSSDLVQLALPTLVYQSRVHGIVNATLNACSGESANPSYLAFICFKPLNITCLGRLVNNFTWIIQKTSHDLFGRNWTSRVQILHQQIPSNHLSLLSVGDRKPRHDLGRPYRIRLHSRMVNTSLYISYKINVWRVFTYIWQTLHGKCRS